MVPIAKIRIKKHDIIIALAFVMTGTMILLPAVPALSVPITWPVPDSHEMLNAFAAGTPPSIFSSFQEGIDIRASGNGGETVVVARKGEIVKNNNDNGGMITIKVNVGTASSPVYEYDSYLHIMDRIAQNSGIVEKGTTIGKISNSYYNTAGKHHLHFDVAKSENPSSGDFLNPLMRFTENADRDPLGNSPKLKDTNSDGKTLLITKSGNHGDVFKKQPIEKDVDLIADVVDEMSTKLGYATNPHKVGYYIKPLFDKGVVAHGVKNASNPYLLAKFDDAWFPGVSNSVFEAVYDKTRLATINNPPFNHINHFIVTNTKGEDGSVANVDGNQYWRTNAKDDGAADTVAHANYAGKNTTTRNAQARFKDGEYEVHVMLGDLVNTVDATAGKLRLDNYKQTAGAGKGGISPPQGAVAPLYGPNMTPYVPDFKPDPSTAVIDQIFHFGDPIGIYGDQYYPDLLMPAYIFDHQDAWNEDDPFINYIIEILVKSDLDGVVPLTYAWNAEWMGRFDVIIDYDRDGLFTWTMDGLGGFQVGVPEPSTIFLLGSGLAGVIGLGRKKLFKKVRP